MKRLALLTYALLLTISTPAQATKPCIMMPEDQFIQDVVAPSDAVIIARVWKFTRTDDPKRKWTIVKVLQQLSPDGDEMLETSIKINNWQANDFPFYSYEKGQKVGLFLKKDGNDYVLTDKSWKSCVPSLWDIRTDDNVYMNFTTDDDSKPKTVTELRAFLNEVGSEVASEDKGSNSISDEQ